MEGVSFQGKSSLLVAEGGELLGFLELRWAFCLVFEKPLICTVESLQDFLRGLRMQVCAFDPFREVFLHCHCRNVFTVEFIVSFLQCKCMIPYEASFPKHVVEMFSIFSCVELVLVCNHMHYCSCL